MDFAVDGESSGRRGRDVATDDDGEAAMDTGAAGRTVVFRLFVALAIVTAVVLLWFAQIARDLYGPEVVRRIHIALAADLALPVVAWVVFRRMNRWRDARMAAPGDDRQP